MLEQARSVDSIKTIIVTGGEPSLSPLLIETIKNAKLIGFNVALTSNILSERFNRFEDILLYLCDSGDALGFSFDSIDKAEMNFIRGCDAYARVVSNLVRLLNIRKKYGYRTTLSSTTALQPENHRSIFDTIDFLLTNGVDQCYIQPRHYYSGVTLENYASQSPPPYDDHLIDEILCTVKRLCELAATDSRIKLPDTCFENWVTFFTNPASLKGPCKSKNFIFITPYGEILGCGYGSPLANMNITNISLVEYLESEMYTKILEMTDHCKICMHACS